VEADSVIWIARLRIGRVVTFRVSVFRAFRAAVLIVSVAAADLVASTVAAVVDSAVIASVAAGDLGAVALAALEDSVAGSGGADEDNAWNFPIFISTKAQTTN
jgi:hypothetical protein